MSSLPSTWNAEYKKAKALSCPQMAVDPTAIQSSNPTSHQWGRQTKERKTNSLTLEMCPLLLKNRSRWRNWLPRKGAKPSNQDLTGSKILEIGETSDPSNRKMKSQRFLPKKKRKLCNPVCCSWVRNKSAQISDIVDRAKERSASTTKQMLYLHTETSLISFSSTAICWQWFLLVLVHWVCFSSEIFRVHLQEFGRTPNVSWGVWIWRNLTLRMGKEWVSH